MNSEQTINTVLYNKLKPSNENTFLSMILITLSMSVMSYIVRQLTFYMEDIELINILNINFLLHKIYKKNSVEYAGKINCGIGFYNNEMKQTSLFGERFKALWQYIIENIDNNKSIHSIKEQTIDKTQIGIYIVNQKDQFIVSKEFEIYAYTYIENNESKKKDEDDGKVQNKTSTIIIELYSYKSSIETIKQFVETITTEYLIQLENSRKNKKFIYTFTKFEIDNSISERWSETFFESARRFENLFFENKQTVLDKVDFFINNKKWYYDKGIPYSLGIGIYGPPGTGKTSFIKALANYTDRHIITISLKLIKTKKQLDAIFFENQYNESNEKGIIGFDKKIIVFEDIDCIGDIVLSREHKKNKTVDITQIKLPDIVKNTELTKLILDEPITLDDILNLWDGIRETPGRILAISSNHYDKLDPALKRPGRIDITMDMSYATRNSIAEIYKHLFEHTIDAERLEKIPDRFYSPAEIINIYMAGDKNNQKFLDRLEKSEKPL